MNLMTERELRETLHTSRTTLWRWRRDIGFPRPRLIGKRKMLYSREEVERWIQSRPAA